MRWFLVRTPQGWEAKQMLAPFGVPLFARSKYRGPFSCEAHANAARAFVKP